MSATVLAFPPARRVGYVYRQASVALGLNRQAAERHIVRQVALQRDVLLGKGVAPEAVERHCAELEAAMRAAMLRAVYAPGGAA